MSLERVPELGSKPVALTVKLPPPKRSPGDTLGESLRELYRRGELCDVCLVCSGHTFAAHRIALVAESEVFKQGLSNYKSDALARQEVRLSDVSNPEAVKFMLDFIYRMDSAIYGDYDPRSQEINKDVLRLAKNFRLPGLTDRATHFLAKDLTTGNVVERLTICEEFGLDDLKDRILGQLACNKRALSEVANSPQIMSYPKLMQALLQQTAGVPDDEPSPQPKKRGRPART